MENAAKALTMAGSVLLAIMIITVLIFGYQKLNETSAEKEEAKIIEQIVEFNKEFESYNRKDVYGAELLSLVNKIEDYNKKVGEYDEGYEAITGEITFTLTWNGIKGKKTIVQLMNIIKQIEANLKTLETKVGTEYKTKQLIELYNNVQNLSQYSDSYRKDLDKKLKTYNVTETDIKEYIKNQALLTELKRRYFKCTKVVYDDETTVGKTGRIREMHFMEIDTSKLN